MNEPQPVSPLESVNLRPLSRTELNFILRAIGDAQHILAVRNGMRATESRIGEEVEEETSHVMDDTDLVALLELVQRLLGATDLTPEPLDHQVGIRAAIEASGDTWALRLYDRWRDAEARREP